MERFVEDRAASALTEPLVGSGASVASTTTSKRDGDSWISTARKRCESASASGATSRFNLGARYLRQFRSRGVSSRIRHSRLQRREDPEQELRLKSSKNGHITLKKTSGLPEANRIQRGGNLVSRHRQGAEKTDERYAACMDGDRMRHGRIEAALKCRPKSGQLGKRSA